jgi:transcriptional regulator with XRE-family HTH domain
MKNAELAKKIKELRARKGLSQDELATASQLNLRTIQRIESGETEPKR